MEMEYQPVGVAAPKRYVLVNPLGLVQQGAMVYLVATIYLYRDPRILTLHRVRSARLSETPAEPPEGFNLQGYIQSGAFGFGEYDRWIDLVAVFKSGAGEHLLETPLSAEQQAERLTPGEVKIGARVICTPQLVWWLTGLGPDVEIPAPDGLREEIAQRHRSACGL